MYARLNARYTQLAEQLNILDQMNDALSEDNSWSHALNPLFLVNVDPATLNTPKKRRKIYDMYLNNQTGGLERMGRIVQLHPNLILAKVEHWIRLAKANA